MTNLKRRKVAVSVIGQGYLGFPLAGLYPEKGYDIQPNLVLVDGNLPEMERSNIYRRIRDMSEIPVLVITVNGHKFDQQKAAAPGAENVTKPVDFHELLAQLYTFLRGTIHATQEDDPGRFYDDELEIKLRSHQVYVRGQRVKLSPIEFKILTCLIKNRGHAVSHDQLLEEGWGTDRNDNDSSVKLYVSYLRHKIEKDPHNPKLILTEWGVGYRFSIQSKQSLDERLDHITINGFPINHDKPDKPPDLVISVIKNKKDNISNSSLGQRRT